MSHITKIELKIESLDALKQACENMGLQFNEGKQTFKWFGTHMGDYPLPEGFSKEDMGKCDHSISIPGNPGAYEVGVCNARDGSGGYELLWDFWNGGYGLQDAVGEEGKDLQEEYALCYSEQELIQQGYIVSRETQQVQIGGI